MKYFHRILLLVLYISGIATLLIVTVDKYSWMSEMDPSFSPDMLPVDNGSGDRGVVSFLAFVFALLTQVIAFIFEKSKTWKTLSVFCAALAIVIYVLR
ncbi:hypothetical protein ACN5L3_002469 [Cronobacter malonaticus]|uniref:hypothetical protein n=1 Tax=Cronobacter malonaticus TaxID=413503 RepID=UPI000CFE11A6|nr:hypothetical protein [Cronobacter malonaticus]ELY2622240.1 hypothetical protein [Cronobacter malonaticus]ELY3623332.1 hypothetical protein [Cronobacter malonaticus]ELZ9927313.1 hypothetical protein [Cronobacter malonaticus]EMA8636987.1 hypothetical protein [Cronobacter malonaticus]MDT3537053.1 hypothetical protein [Cronobacter malonaticus]